MRGNVVRLVGMDNRLQCRRPGRPLSDRPISSSKNRPTTVCRGLRIVGKPTLINNVETLAHIPAILRGGGASWPRVRLWSVSGAVGKPGCYEAPVDVTARQLIDDYAGGATEEIGAIVPGGAASGILPPAALDSPLTR